MAIPALSLRKVLAMNTAERTAYFEQYARHFGDSPTPYAIRVGSKTLISADTMDLRQKFDKLLRREAAQTGGTHRGNA